MEEKKTILVDSHVHIYDCFDIEKFFKSAVENFCGIHNQLKLTEKFIGVLFLTEAVDTNYFKKISENKSYFSDTLNIKFESTQEENSVRIKIDPGNYIIIISGQQIVTAENLEVLAIGTRNRYEYGKNISDTIDYIHNDGAIPIVPWGAGKWIGKREQVVKELINKRTDFFLGDNGNRPSFWNTPSIFKLAKKKGIFNLPGSDPLNFESEAIKPGSYGFYFNEKIDIDSPVLDLKQKILGNKNQFNTYGKLESPLRFFRNQISIQINKKLRKKSR